MTRFISISILALVVFLLYRKTSKKRRWRIPAKPFPSEWKIILTENVAYYNTLSTSEKERFEFKVHEFLLNCRITGIKTSVETIDRLLIAASAIIPIFQFHNWRYRNIHEVLLYPSSFNRKYQLRKEDSQILGMVGYGYMDGKMILSKKALRLGFDNKSDKKNTAIHEFVHIIDKADGTVDGIPQVLLDKQYAIPWLDLIKKKIDEIDMYCSDINPYGATNNAEFFSVASEYFFERPKLLEENHPRLYELLEMIFQQDMANKKLNQQKVVIGRNSPCPCNSGKKFKKCCGKIHYN